MPPNLRHLCHQICIKYATKIAFKLPTFFFSAIHGQLHRLKIRHSLPHSDAANADAGVICLVTGVQDADAQASEGALHAFLHLWARIENNTVDLENTARLPFVRELSVLL